MSTTTTLNGCHCLRVDRRLLLRLYRQSHVARHIRNVGAVLTAILGIQGSVMLVTDQSTSSSRLAARFAVQISQTRDDLLHLSNLHQDFVKDCLAAVSARHKGGEVLPHLVAQSLRLDDKDRRMLAAATLALAGYACLVDFELDRTGYLNGRVATAASALLAWGIATIGGYTAGTKYADVFMDNVNQAMAGQYADLRDRSATNTERECSNIDKNRPTLAVIAGFCAAAREQDDRLICSAEAILGTIQLFDDLHDVKEDYDENNNTVFVRIVRECLPSAAPLTASDMYRVIISDPRTKTLLAGAAEALDRALLILDARRDAVMIDYFSDVRN